MPPRRILRKRSVTYSVEKANPVKLLLVLVAALIVACSNSPGPTSTSAKPTSPPETTASQRPHPKSQLTGATLPDGSFDNAEGKYGGTTEYWSVPTAYDDTVQDLRNQLPINRDFGDLTWCAEKIDDDATRSTWGDAAQLLYVGVEKGGHVSISRAPDPKGCTH
ncbi:MAG: hypothetical protein QOH60_2448 [Mycobacterium sp.]|jgi:hypothetical protein|nr:hypothetical protein [Mycobacterium sp.]